MKVTSCRVCSSPALAPVLDLGRMPAVNYFPARDELTRDVVTYPLRLCACQQCGLVMLDEVVATDAQFRDYHYLTSASPPLIQHFTDLAADCRERGWLPSGARVLDIGANDGTLLDAFQQAGARPLGIDPARQAVAKARARGLTVLPELFGNATAARLAPALGRFSLITCTNVLAHTHDVKDFLAGIMRLLDDDGILVVEFAHLLDVIVRNQFDVIYHEHVSYFSLRPLMRLFAASGLEIFDARKVATQGGSLRVFARRAVQAAAVASAPLRTLRDEEDDHRIHELPTLTAFADRVRGFRDELRRLIAGLRAQQLKIVGLGAPAKGVVLLSFCGLGPHDVSFLVDSTDLKHGRYLPGVHIPVRPETCLETDAPAADYFLLLAWNFQETLLRKVEPHRARGAKVIVPFPTLRVI